MRNTSRAPAGWKGNKASLPSKPCTVCGRTMTWRRAWARNWEEVRYCSEPCRRTRPRDAQPADTASTDTPANTGRNPPRER